MCLRAPSAHYDVRVCARRVLVVSIVKDFSDDSRYFRAHDLLKHEYPTARPTTQIVDIVNMSRACPTLSRWFHRRCHRTSGTCSSVSQRARADRAPPRWLARTTAAARRENGAPACRLQAAPPQRRRRGRVLRALLAAAGRAQRHVLLIYEEQAHLALGGVPPCPHWPRVHTRSSAGGVDASIESAGDKQSGGKGGAAGRCTHHRIAHRARIA